MNETVVALGAISPTSSSSNAFDSLDLTAIFKMSQALSSEIELEKLLSLLLHTVIKATGSDRCVLMLMEDDRLLIQGVITEDTEPVVLQQIPIEKSQDIPLKLICKVQHNQQITVLVNAIADPTLASDPYILQQQPKSILCSPILRQGKLIGILYLENNLVTGAFTSDRVEILNLLCAQAAISLENACLYRQSQAHAQELEQSLEKLRDTEARFHRIADNIPGVVYQLRWNPDGSSSTPYISSGCMGLFGVTPEAIMTGAVDFRDMEHPDDRPKIEQAAIEATQALTTFEQEARIVSASGSVKWIQSVARPERQADGSIVWDGVKLDITDRKQAETALIESEAYHRNLFDQSSIGLLLCSMTGQLLYANTAYGNIIGRTPEEILPLNYWEITPEKYAEAEQLQLQNLQETGRYGPYEKEYIHKNGRRVPVRLSGVIVERHGEQFIWSSVEDIDDRKQAEAIILQKSQDLERTLAELQIAHLQMVQSEKMSALGNLVTGIAHEINNPIGFIAGNLSEVDRTIQDLVEHLNLYRNQSDPAAITDHAEEIDLGYVLEDLPKIIDSMKLGCDRIRSISTSLRTFSRADQVYPITANLHDGIDSTILILKHRLKANSDRPTIEVITNYGSIPPIECFPGQLNQVFMNILANAIDALEEANQTRTFAEIQAQPNQIEIQTHLSDSGNQVVIQIRDNGLGMTDEVKQQVFDHLFTTKAVGAGTGLGLAIARQIVVEKHGGTITVDSAIGKGTTFVISLPR